MSMRDKVIGAKRKRNNWKHEVDGKVFHFHDKKPRRAAKRAMLWMMAVGTLVYCADFLGLM